MLFSSRTENQANINEEASASQVECWAVQGRITCASERSSNHLGEFFQVVDEGAIFKPPRFIVRSPQDRGGMHSGHYVWSKRGFEELAALFGHAKLRTEQCLRSRRAQGHNHFRFDYGSFSLEPGATGSNLQCVWFFVYAPFAARLPLEMFDDVRDVCLFAINACFFQRFIEQATGWSNERLARQIFFIAGLFADKHHYRPARAFTEDGLRSAFPKIATFAISRSRAQRRQSYFWWEEVCS